MQKYSKGMMVRLIVGSLFLVSLICLAPSTSMAVVVPAYSTPGLLSGLWQKSINSSTIEIQPGDIEIGGIIYYQGTPAQITLSGNLRAGETVQANTYYYLYAVMTNSGTLSYEFSSVQPTMNQFGTTGIDFESADPNTPLYHPIEGLSWRYIGQVYTDASSNILPFDKVKPGYWESSWTPIPGVQTHILGHGLAKFPKTVHMVCSQSANGSNPAIPPSLYWVGSGDFVGFQQYGGVLTQTSIPIYFGTYGIYWGVDNGWHTSGYYKLILTP
ncbi:MAG: hypothetical protein ACYDIC_12900 [Desulfobaccales bacterium]